MCSAGGAFRAAGVGALPERGIDCFPFDVLRSFDRRILGRWRETVACLIGSLLCVFRPDLHINVLGRILPISRRPSLCPSTSHSGLIDLRLRLRASKVGVNS